MKRSIILLLLFLWIRTAYAAGPELAAYYEFGRRSAQGLVEEEDQTDELDIYKYNVKFSHGIKPDTSYYLKYYQYDRDYDTLQNLNNILRAVGIGFDTPIYAADSIRIKTGPDFEFREKIYGNSPVSNYDQVMFNLPLTFKKKDDWTIKVSGGVNSYHYPNAPNDQFKTNAKIEAMKKFLDCQLELFGFYKLQYINREKIANRLERAAGAGADIKLDMPAIKSLELGLEEGMDNTIIYDEARDDSFDYKYLMWYLKTKHSILNKVKMSVKYTDSSRVYADFNHNFDGFGIDNIWDAQVFETKDASFNIKLDYMHKQFRYPYVSYPFSFHNNALYTDAELVKKDGWKLQIGSDVRFYNYPANSLSDKIYYVERLGFEKHLFKKDFTVGFDYKLTFKNYLHKPDITENLYRIRANYNF